VGKGADVATWVWLRELEIEYNRSGGRLPPTIYHQIDGGGENANPVLLAIAEILVHRGLTRKIVITRLPVGHTHEVSVALSESLCLSACVLCFMCFVLV
jgi:hypothetical protein